LLSFIEAIQFKLEFHGVLIPSLSGQQWIAVNGVSANRVHLHFDEPLKSSIVHGDHDIAALAPQLALNLSAAPSLGGAEKTESADCSDTAERDLTPEPTPDPSPEPSPEPSSGGGDRSHLTVATATRSEREVLSESQRALLRRLKAAAYFLYQKYIRTYSEMEVNISSALRARYYEQMEDRLHWMECTETTVEALYAVFDDVIVEMYRLMDCSLLRFLQSDGFAVLKEELLRERGDV